MVAALGARELGPYISESGGKGSSWVIFEEIITKTQVEGDRDCPKVGQEGGKIWNTFGVWDHGFHLCLLQPV